MVSVSLVATEMANSALACLEETLQRLVCETEGYCG